MTKSNLEADSVCMSGIYRITCKTNSKYYIGQAKKLSQREATHFSCLKHNKHDNRYLQNCYNKYGKEDLTFEILEYCEIYDLDSTEQGYLDKHFGAALCMNLSPTVKTTKGVFPGQDTRLKMTVAHTGINNSFFGKHHSEESKRKMSVSHKLNYELGKPHGRQGKETTESTKQKLRQVNLGKKLSTETKEKIGIHFQKDYVFLNPKQELVRLTNLSKFCIENNLSNSYMTKVHKGTMKQHKGWTKG